MHIFLDTANIDQIRQAAKMGLISGVTTNPSLVAREGSSNLKARILEICSLVDGSISVEVLSLDTKGMIKEAREVAAWHRNVTVKIPVSEAGYEAISILSKEDIKTNLTLCFSPTQTLLGARAGATYVSPFVGRLDDIGHRGMDVVAETVEIFAKHKFQTQVIAASLRHPLHVIEAARCGSHIATVPYDILMKMMKHPLTDIGIERFIEDWKKVKP
ncbi:MAG: fructose-6-phosphate aldolase [Dehalococcoidia bacterium]|jgi:transaldolase